MLNRVMQKLSEMIDVKTALMQQEAACLQAVQSPQLGTQSLPSSPFVQIQPIAQICANEKMKNFYNDESSFINPFQTRSQDELLLTFPWIGGSNLSGDGKKISIESNLQDEVEDKNDPAYGAEQEMADCILHSSSPHLSDANEYFEVRMMLKRARKVASQKRTEFRAICFRFAELLVQDGEKTSLNSKEEDISQAQKASKRVRFEQESPLFSQKKWKNVVDNES